MNEKKLALSFKNYKYITQNTNEIDEETIFLLTNQNKKYYENLDIKTEFITPRELIKHWQLESLKVIGITGTNGKTTTSSLMHASLLKLKERPALQGTRGLFVFNECLQEKKMTTPSILDTLNNMRISRENNCNYFIMEVSSHAIDQNRIEGISFALKIHTNVTSDHLDYHKTQEEYLRVKSKFFQDSALKLINVDDINSIKYNKQNSYTYSINNESDYQIEAYSLLNGIKGSIKHSKERAEISSQMVGLFNVYNITASISAVNLLTNKPLQEICDSLKDYSGVEGRMQVVNRAPLIIVDFAHTADSMEQVLSSITNKDISVVFGAGGDRDREKRPKMASVSQKYSKYIYITNDNPRNEDPNDIINDIKRGFEKTNNVQIIQDRYQAIKKAIEQLPQDDVLLILGKGDEEYQEVKGVKYPFSDKQAIKEILNNLYKV